MSDYITPKTTTGGTSARGLVIALVVIVLFIAGLAAIGSGSGPASDDGAAVPAVSDTAPAAPATTGTVTE
ncbi:hypothetical protein SuNHUV7_36310 (plasmid) [Pseudoseohaeicola sp. NH-UV-7]|uniref:hypothetical protein n=1 Tax=unclassified Sulfitobacter TaxID=196795 RepID=UPI000E0BD7ED|nr:hypothetical protein [Sulfitobacter sp. JL08]AXI54495.1 hypothetical protein C1J05_08320 [Sulfitobacter sp. JL08]